MRKHSPAARRRALTVESVLDRLMARAKLIQEIALPLMGPDGAVLAEARPGRHLYRMPWGALMIVDDLPKPLDELEPSEDAPLGSLWRRVLVQEDAALW